MLNFYIAIAGLLGLVNAQGLEDHRTPIKDVDMQNFLKNDHATLAQLNAPVYFFGQSHRWPPCLPLWAYGGSPTTPDVYTQDRRTPPVNRCFYPDVGAGCRIPSFPAGHNEPADPFPLYYTVRDCPATNDVRVVLSLFYQKDGAFCEDIAPFAQCGGDEGHDFDWENVMIRYTLDAPTQIWKAADLFMSQHGGYERVPWSDIQQTLTTDLANGTNPRNPGPEGIFDHPKVFVAWAKHPHFDTKNTGFNDIASQSIWKAFRSDDWYHFVLPQNFIEASGATAAGQVMGSQNWGDADSTPPSVDDKICSIEIPLHDERSFINITSPGIVDYDRPPGLGEDCSKFVRPPHPDICPATAQEWHCDPLNGGWAANVTAPALLVPTNARVESIKTFIPPNAP